MEQQSEDIVGAMCLWAEARGDGVAGMTAVAWVIKTLALRHDVSAKRVILFPKRFSSFNMDNPERHLLLDAWQSDAKHWLSALEVWRAVMDGQTPDPTNGADHYVTTALYDSPPGPHKAAWIETMRDTVVIGRQIFGKAA